MKARRDRLMGREVLQAARTGVVESSRPGGSCCSGGGPPRASYLGVLQVLDEEDDLTPEDLPRGRCDEGCDND